MIFNINWMTKRLVIFIVLVVILAIFYAIYFSTTQGANELLARVHKEYPMIRINETLNNVVSDIVVLDERMIRKIPHRAYIVLDNLQKRRMFAADEYFTEVGLDSILRIGDTITKNAGSDTICIHKLSQGDARFYFQLRRDDGYPMIPVKRHLKDTKIIRRHE